ncbi:cytospin-A isoform X1 [Hypomesus transpacificus]|uniref:cytospin-A isoform X1 n=1 Tax=Hypomesus transpacificus TaxID=137520 RepID=UPI001F0774A5|nr:cytospin-A isoform X1 [Hypomesus transpacificus]XP_046869953.1 cytospin-A isoform X1 [Hypomesus transpacificus]
MGNFSSKDGHGPTGPHQDIFHTPPTSPAAADPPTVPKLTLPHPDQPRSSALSTGGKKSPPFSDFIPSTPASDWKPLMPVTPDCSVIGPTSSTQQEKLKCTVTPEEQVAVGCNNGLSSSTPSAHAQQGKTKMTSPNQPNQSPSFLDSSSSLVSLSGQSWKERDSGLSQSLLMGPVSRDSQGEMERLVEECRTTLGLSDSKDKTVAGVLKSLLTEICCLRETIQTERVERGEWLQFQSDLQVAVTVADRLRSEAEEELSALRTAHRDTERELAAAQQRQKETDIQMVTLRGELRESRQRKASLAQAQGRIEAQAPNPAHTHTKANVETHALESQFGRGRERAICKIGRGGKGEGMEKGSQNEKMKNVVEEESHIDVKGVVKRYLRNVTNEERSGEEGCAPIETRRIGTTERSRSLSRLPVSSDLPAVENGTSQFTTATTAGSTNKNLNQPRARKNLEHQDSWSSTHTGKQEETLNKYNSALSDMPPSSRSQDGFNLLLRRHGGSKRNSLLRWCQSRTQGYKNIDITNFSSSWADGLAFCAVYHTYLPSHIPYCTLSPESKKENLSLAFMTGENVGITQSLTMEEMLRPGGPDWQRVLVYVESIYRHFEM